jgi:hypothetical protein
MRGLGLVDRTPGIACIRAFLHASQYVTDMLVSSLSTEENGHAKFRYRRSAHGYCAVEQGQAVYSRRRTITIASSTLAYKRAEIVELSDTVRSEKHHA